MEYSSLQVLFREKKERRPDRRLSFRYNEEPFSLCMAGRVKIINRLGKAWSWVREVLAVFYGLLNQLWE